MILKTITERRQDQETHRSHEKEICLSIGTRRFSTFLHSIKKNYGSSAYLDSTKQNTFWNTG